MADIFGVIIEFTYYSLLVSFILSFIRLLKGPTLADRVIALDLIAYLTISFIAIYTLDTGQEAFLDIGVSLALIAFFGTIAFSKYIFHTQKNRSK